MVNSIINKLREYKIKNIVSIDNDWDIKRIEIDTSSKLKDFLAKYRIELDIEESRYIKNEMIESIEDLITTTCKGLDDLKRNILKRCEKIVPLENTLASLDKTFELIKETDATIEIYKECSKDIDLSKYNGNTLFFLDRNMGEGYEDVIIEKILQIKGAAKDSRDLILIYSSDCGSDYEKHENKIRYIESKYNKTMETENKLVVAYQLWAIKKVGDVQILLRDINEMLSKSIYGSSLINIVSYKKASEMKAYEDLLLIDIEDLQGAFRDSFIEGDNIILSFERIMKALINKNYNCDGKWTEDLIKSFQFLLEYEKERINTLKGDIVKKIAAPANNQDPYRVFKDEHVKSKLISCINNASEYAIADYSINRLYYDISTGDLFRYKRHDSEIWEYGMIMSQECNNVIRMPIAKVTDKPDRKNTEIKLLMFDCDEIPKQTLTGSKFNTLNSSISTRIWPIKVDSSYYSLNPTERVVSIESCILDLCSLNENGKAKKINTITDILKHKGYQSEMYFRSFYSKPFWQEFKSKGRLLSSRYKSMLESYLKECSVAIECDTKCIEKEHAEKYMKEMEAKFFDDAISMLYGIKYSNDEFTIERICRIEPKRTLLAIQDYIYKLSRTGAEPVISLTNQDIS